MSTYDNMDGEKRMIIYVAEMYMISKGVTPVCL